MAIRAHYAGQCPACRQGFDVGTWIQKRSGRWRHLTCPVAETFSAADVVEAAESAARRARLDPEILMAALVLTHPDRHPPERSAAANAVTAALLAYRADTS